MSDGVKWFRKIMRQCNAQFVSIEHQFRDKDGNTCWEKDKNTSPTFLVKLCWDTPLIGSFLKTSAVCHGSAIKFDETDSSFSKISIINQYEFDKYASIFASVLMQCLALSARGFDIMIQPNHYTNIVLINKNNPYSALIELDLE